MSDEIQKTDEDTNKDGYEKICYLCHRPESKVDKMITIPNNITICSDCMQKTFDQIGMQGTPMFPGMDIINLGSMGMEAPDEFQEKHKVKTKKKKKKSDHVPKESKKETKEVKETKEIVEKKKPEKKKLPEAIRKKIRTELKDEKLPAGKYTSIYKAVEESENKLALNNALVKTFDTTIGSKIYNHIKKIYEDYQR